ncbi:hypothetical protein G7009_01360 [Pseudomonas capeferrum]|uniref:CFI-box-CTERM domain-containing protein n=1 Tax=Pseudomonas capeferrum TaxID=1495066 RepID=UPI0015E3989E|nr:CFI-box-CTERM domain-containing protein [Pseudomonas capeferrum]MBA1200450.1 hypothetical protein [Pseudomonas capeferrum]
MGVVEIESINEAEQYYLKALYVLHQLQANKQVYGSNSRLAGVASPADVDLALKYINRSIEIIPDNAVYLNLKALLLWEGHGNKDAALPLLEKAALINPRDIDIQNNLNAMKTSQCIVATAAFGTPLAEDVKVLRWWRDNYLRKHSAGRLFIGFYYYVGGFMAVPVGKSGVLRLLVRKLLTPIITRIKKRNPDIRI